MYHLIIRALANSRGKKIKKYATMYAFRNKEKANKQKVGKDFSPSAFPWKRVLSIKIKIESHQTL